MKSRPLDEKLGFVPGVKVLKPMACDQKELTGASLVIKVMMYYGGIIGKAIEGRASGEAPDLQGMSRLLHNAVQLDPYNMDAYYLAQGFLTWDARQFKVANDLLDYGMKYRVWDSDLPYFAGFNSAFFLKDYDKAAQYYKRAGEVSGNQFFKSLAGRYLQESGQTELAIAYLTDMEHGEKNVNLKKIYEVRLAAFKEVRRIEKARDEYMRKYGSMPDSIEQLVRLRILPSPPVDPYGGKFYILADGKVATTSKFAFSGQVRGK
jgi:tetratricopeptide (TPR) repeat protein